MIYYTGVCKAYKRRGLAGRIVSPEGLKIF